MNCAGSTKFRTSLAPVLCGICLWLACAPIFALPTDPEVVAGEATINVDGAVMDVQQQSQRAIIDYQDFDLAAEETVNFIQPNAQAAVLNRVIGGDLAEIYGRINANGQVFLINPNGVMLGQGAELNVGGLLITSLDINQADFLAGNDLALQAADDAGSVDNRGTIHARQQVLMLAPEVANSGTIQADAVGLHSAGRALVRTAGSQIPVLVEREILAGQGEVINQGRIDAAAVALTGAGKDAQVSNSGVIRAVRASNQGGVIELLAPEGTVTHSGELDASGSSGGEVEIAADFIDHSGSSSVAATAGDAGRVNIHADQSLALHGHSRIGADAGVDGKGGEILVVAEKNAWFTESARMSARGGSLSGDGGFIEFSGHEYINVNGQVDINSVNGKAGIWYIDPTDIAISNTDSGGGFTGGNPKTWTLSGTPATSSIHIATLRNALNTADVIISTNSAAASAGNITWNGNLDVNGFNTIRSLTLTADGAINFQSGNIYDSDLNTLTDGVNITATAGTGITIADNVGVNGTLGKVNLTATTGDITMTGLGSIANAQDAIRVTATAGRILDGGDSLYDATAPLASGGVILSARDGITGIDLNANYLSATSSAGSISLSEASAITVTTLSAATSASASLTAVGQIITSNSSTFAGANQSLYSSGSTVTVPQNGITVTGNLYVRGTDIVDQNNSRTVSFGADHLTVITGAAGGNSIFTTTTNLLSVSNASSNTLTFNDVNAVTTSSIAPLTGITIINSGTGFDLTVGSSIELNDETGTLTLNASKDLLINDAISDTIGAVSNTNGLNLTAGNNVTFSSAGLANAGAGNVTVTASNGNVVLGSIAGASMTVSATGSITDANGGTANLSGTSATLTAGTSIATSSDRLDATLSSLTLTASNGSAYITNSQALSLTSTSIQGDLDITLPTAGDLTLVQSAPTITGTANFNVTNGQIIIPNAGWSIAGGLTFAATNLLDTDTNITLGGAAASITLSNAAADRAWSTSLSSLALNLTGAGNFTLTDTNALTLTSATTGANASFTTTNANLTLSADPSIGGNLSLITSGSGNVVLPTTGISESGNLTITADDLLDTDRTLTLGAASATITLRSAASSMVWNSSFTDLVLSLTGGGDFALTDTNALTLTSASTSGNASFTSTNADLTLSADPAVTGNLSLITTGTGNVIIPTAGISQPAGLTISANDILDTDRSLTLSATNASITLRDNSAAHSISSSFSALTLALTGAATFNLTDSNTLTLSSASSGGDVNLTATGADLTVSANASVSGTLNLTTTGTGNVVIPTTGFTQSAGLTIDANDLIDTDRTVALGATSANISLRNATSSMAWASSFSSLVLSLTGGGDFALTDTNALTLTSASTSGNASFTTTNADLTLSADPVVTGNLSLITTGAGNVIIPTTGISQPAGLTISANDILDTDRSLTLSATNASITLRDNSAVHSISSSFSALTLALTGTAAFNLTDSNALALSSASSGGDVNLTATGADLTVNANTTITGTLNLTTTGTGNVVIPNTGFAQSAALTINANDLIDTDRTLTLGATNADITLRNAASAMSWTSSFSNLILALTGGGDFALTDTNALTLTSASTSGNASFTATNADLTLSADPAITGNFSLITTGTGNVIIPTTGISQPAGLTISANDFLDTDRTLTLAATNADITLRNSASSMVYTTSFSNLVLSLSGGGDFALTDSNALTLTSASTAGNASFTTTNADLTLSADPAVTGNLSLITTGAGNVIIPTTGISQPAGLTISANDILDADRTLTLAATNASITLRDNSAVHSISSSFSALTLALTGAATFNLTDSNALTLSSASSGGDVNLTATGADLTLSANTSVSGTLNLTTTGTGNVVMPTTGFTQSAGLTIDANDLIDTDRTITLSATNANISLRNATSSMAWASSFSSLILSLTGGGDFALTDSNALTLASASTAGNASFTTTNADLTLSADPAVTGNLSLITTGAGNVIIPTTGISQPAGLTISANDILDTDRTLTLAATNASITLRDNSAVHSITSSFSALTLALTGAATFNLTDSNALTLSSASSGGDVNLTATGADLTLSANTTISGTLNLTTTGTGNVVIPTTGFTQSAGLTIDANDLIDTDRTITLSATSANISLRNATSSMAWTSSFSSLVLSLTGGGDFVLTDINALTLTSASTSGNASFTTTNADLTLSADPAVTGNLSLITTGAGNVIIPTTGISQPAGLTISANDILDTDRSLTLSATNASITLRDNSAVHSISSSFSALTLALTGAATFNLTDSNALTLSSASSGGDVNLTATGADLTLSANTTISGTLNLTTTGTGNVVIPTTGFTQSAGLTIDANDLIDTDRTITLSATNANVSLRNAASAMSWTSSFSNLILALTGGGDFALTDTNALTLTSASTSGNASFTTTNADLTLSADPAVTGNLSLITTGAGNVIIPTTGISQPAGLTISANDILDTDRSLTLSATNASITLRDNSAVHSITSSFSALSLALTGMATFNLTDSDALTLSSASSGGDVNLTATNADLTLSANTSVSGTLNLTTTGTGNVVIPTSGFTQSAGLTLDANDLIDTDRTVTLGATNANISLRNAASAMSWTSSFSNLILALTGGGDFTLTDSNALTLTSASTSGNASFTSTNADLTLSADPAVTGNLSLITTGTGNVIIPTTGISQPAELTISANDILDTDRSLTLSATNASITLRDNSAVHSISSSFSALTLALTGAATFNLTDSNALTLSSASSGGDVNLTATGADLTLSANTTISGTLNLTTTGTGNVVIPTMGFTQSAGLTLDANDIIDTDRTVTLGATNANISLRNAASAMSWTSSFSNLILSLTGGGDFALTDSNALTLTSASTAGSASFTATNADLTLSADPAVTGNLSLITTGTGNVIIPTAGISQPAGLTISANDLLDTDRTVTLAATNADISLRNAASSMVYATSFSNLVLSLTGGGDFALTDTNALTLTSASTSGNASFTTTNADLTLSADPAVSSNLSLITTGVGNVIIPATGISQPAGLTISANDVLDTDRNLILAANNASITLRDNAAAHTLASSLNSLSLALTGNATFNLTDTDALTLTAASSGGDVSITTSNADLTLAADTSVGGILGLTTTGSGNVVVPTTGFIQSAALTLNANDLMDTDRTLTLGANNADINLRNATSAMAWATSFNNLVLSLTGGGDFALTDSNALTLTSASTAGNASFTTTSADLTLSADPLVTGNLSLITSGSGNVILPVGGIAQPAGLTIISNDLLDTDRNFSLSGTSASITLRDNSTAHILTSGLNSLSLALTGAAAFTVNDSDALTLTAASSGGDIFISTNNADLTLGANTSVSGTLNLTTTGAGNLVVPVAGFTQSAALTVNASDIIDTDRTLALGATNANITLRNASSPMFWNTDFTNLIMSLTGGGDFALTDNNALTLTSVSGAGNASFTTTNADLTLSADTAVTANLSLLTTGTGNVIIPVGGISQLAGLTINANDLLDTDRTFSVSATNASITLRDNSSVHTVASNLNSLALALTGNAAFNLIDSNSLSVNTVSSGGEVSITATNADLTLGANTSVSGRLNLTTTGTGNVIVPIAGFTQLASLTINANDLTDTDRTIALAATDADITLRNATTAMAWTTSFDNLILSLIGGGDFALTDSNALTLSSASTSGNASFTTTNADLTLSADPAITGNFSLITTGTGNVIIPTTGISQPAGLTINANDLLDTDRAVTLAATNADITLRNAASSMVYATSFSNLVLSLTGGGDFALTDTNALTLTSASTSGNASFTTTNADLTLSADPAVTGNLSLITTGAGNVIIPTTGISQPAGLTISANDVLDTDRNLILAANNASITLRDNAAAHTLASSLNSLSLALTGNAAFNLTDTDALTLIAASSGGDVSITTSNADLTLAADTSVGGILGLTTTGIGNVVVPTTGFIQSAALTINANDLIDTDRTLTLGANNADISLRNATSAMAWATSFNTLILSLTGGGDFALIDSNALTLTSASVAGNASFTSTNGDLTLSTDPAVSGNLSLITTGGGNVIIPVGGISQPAGLTVSANDIVDTDRTLTLAASNAAITLRDNSAAHSITSSFSALSLALMGTATFNLTDSDALTLSAAISGGDVNLTATSADLTVSANTNVSGTLNLTTTGTGNIVVPTAGFSQLAGLTINANDLLDTDHTLSLAASNANISLRNASSALAWATGFNNLILSLTGGGDFALTDSNALTLTSASSAGNASFTTTNADLTLAADPAVTGNLSLMTTGSGNVIIPVAGISQSADLTISANDILDTDRSLILSANHAAITLRDNSSVHSLASNFNSLTLALSGNAAFNLTDNNDLRINAASSGGDVSITSSNADITLVADTLVSGRLNLITTGTGNVVVPNAGFTQSAALTINANDLIDADRTLSLGATNADITLRNATSATVFNSRFNTLILALTGGGEFALTNSNALTLASANTAGNASFTTINADLTLATDPAVSGNLSLNTTGSGNVIIPASGISQPAGLTINTNDLLDTDRSLNLGANNASITLRDNAQEHSLSSSIGTLSLLLNGAGRFNLIDSDALTLNAATSGGDVFITTTDADLTLAANTAVSGTLNLITTGSGNILLQDTGFTQLAGLRINANDLMDSDRTISLSAPSADITLRHGVGARSWSTEFNDLTLSLASGGHFALIDASALRLQAVTTLGSASFTATNGDLILTADPAVTGNLTLVSTGNGNVIIPTGGISQSAGLTIDAHDLFDTDRTVNLTAANASITLRNNASAHTLISSLDSLSLALSGAGAFNLTDSDGLTLDAASSGGDVAIATTNADLRLSGNTTVGGTLHLTTTGSGNLIVPAAGFAQSAGLNIRANNLLAANTGTPAAAKLGQFLLLAPSDNTITLAATDADISLRNVTSPLQLATSFNNLSLALMGSGDFALTDSDALTLGLVSTAGSASFTTTNADLTLSTDPAVAGNLSLLTTGSGNVIIPSAGISQPAGLLISANDVLATDGDIILAATDASITLRSQLGARSWQTAFERITLTSASADNFALNDAGSLLIEGVTTAGRADFTAQNGDITLASNPSVGGALHLTTTGTGSLLLNNSGINHGSDLFIDVYDLQDADRSVSLIADALDLSLRGAQGDLILNSQVDHLSLNAASGFAVRIDNSRDLTLGAINVAGQIEISSLGNLDALLDSINSGSVYLTATDNLDLAAGLNLTGDLIIRAAGLTGLNGQPVSIVADNADIQLTGAGPVNLATTINGLSLRAEAADAITLSNNGSLQLFELAAPSAQIISLDINGTLRIPLDGLSAPGLLSINAQDLLDDDRSVHFSVPQLQVNLTAASGNNLWNLAVDQLDVIFAGSASLQLINNQALQLVDLNADNASLGVENGDLAVRVENGDLLIGADISAADNTADGASQGHIDLRVANGNIRTEGPVNIRASAQAPAAAGDFLIAMRLTDTAASERSISLAEGASITAVGGDILLDTRPAATMNGAQRQFIQAAGAQLAAYTIETDPLTGRVTLNEKPKLATDNQKIGQGHWLAIIADAPEGSLDETLDLTPQIEPIPVTQGKGPDIADEFVKAFGDCDEFDPKNRHRCKINSALKAFLGHWLVGGEMAPKMDAP